MKPPQCNNTITVNASAHLPEGVTDWRQIEHEFEQQEERFIESGANILLRRFGMPRCFLLALTVFATGYISLTYADGQTPASPTNAPIAMDQLGAAVGKQYHGDGLSVSATPEGARLRCSFQRLEGQATSNGLWLRSTTDNVSNNPFRIRATEVGRAIKCASPSDLHEQLTPTCPSRFRHSSTSALRELGAVSVADGFVRFFRTGLTEEYSVSVDGVRQDFIVEQRPSGSGELRVALDVTGASIDPLVNGVRLTLNGSDRLLAYNRLHVTDSTGRELSARMELTDASRLAVLVDDANAAYPVRIDPTFSDANWISMGNHLDNDGQVNAVAVDDSGNLYIGGTFTVAGNITANRIAKWNGNSWSALGSGLGSAVTAVAVSGSDVYVGGNFATAGGNPARCIAKWNGTSWSALGAGVNNTVEALLISGPDVYAGGRFTQAGGAAANRIAKWNGSSWTPLGSGVESWVHALVRSGDDLYVGGTFTKAGGNTVNRIARWNGSNWSALGSGMNGGVQALAVSGSDIYAAGNFSTAGGIAANNIAKWNGSSWTPLGSGLSSTITVTVYALAISGNLVYAGGTFTIAGGSPANRIAKWDGSSWSALGSGLNNFVFALAVSGSNVYAGGAFSEAGGFDSNPIAKWNGSSWSVPDLGLNGGVLALAVSGPDVYASGTFTEAGGSAANRVAKWSGSYWAPLGSGMNSNVLALAVAGGDLYAGGDFTTADGQPANRIAKWNGTSWVALGSGTTDTVSALAVSGSNVYAGGKFTTAGGVLAKYVAKWNGVSWSALGSGMDWYVNALAVSGPDLYAGGRFAIAGGSFAHLISKWNGNIWSALGSGLGDSRSPYPEVYALAVAGSNLYVGGAFSFTIADGSVVNNIARWNGSNWSRLGAGVSSSVQALGVSGTDVYAGGYFTMADSQPVNRIAKWNGSGWSALGSGVDNVVWSLAVSGGNLYAGGYFTAAGGKGTAYAAQVVIGATPLPGQFNNVAYSKVTGFSCTFVGASIGQSYRIQTSPSLAANSWTDFTNFTYTGPTGITVPITGSPKLFLRAVTP